METPTLPGGPTPDRGMSVSPWNHKGKGHRDRAGNSAKGKSSDRRADKSQGRETPRPGEPNERFGSADQTAKEGDPRAVSIVGDRASTQSTQFRGIKAGDQPGGHGLSWRGRGNYSAKSGTSSPTAADSQTSSRVGSPVSSLETIRPEVR